MKFVVNPFVVILFEIFKLPRFYRDGINKIGNYAIYKNVNLGSLGQKFFME